MALNFVIKISRDLNVAAVLKSEIWHRDLSAQLIRSYKAQIYKDIQEAIVNT